MDRDRVFPKVAHVIPDLDGFGGTEATLLRYLRRSSIPLNHHIVIVLKSVGSGSTVGVQIVDTGVSVVSLNQQGWFSALLAMARLRRELRSNQPDVISGWLYASNLFVALT